MLIALILTGFIEVFAGSDDIVCTFPGAQPSDHVMQVRMTPVPSLNDRPGLFRVVMRVDADTQLGARAQPIGISDGGDVLIRGLSERRKYYSVGLRSDGLAALTVAQKIPAAAPEEETVRVGSCENYERVFGRWLSSK